MAQIMAERLPRGIDEGMKKMPVTGELSIEHALLGRILLAMSNTINAIEAGTGPNIDVVRRGCGLIKQVVEQHHMKFEEENIYPRFETGEIADFVRALREQHGEARGLVRRIDARVMTGRPLGRAEMEGLRRDFTSFRDMILAHAAFEESILFPAMEGLMPGGDLQDLKDRNLQQIRELFGDDATRKIYGAIMELESMTGIVSPGSLAKRAP